MRVIQAHGVGLAMVQLPEEQASSQKGITDGLTRCMPGKGVVVQEQNVVYVAAASEPIKAQPVTVLIAGEACLNWIPFL